MKKIIMTICAAVAMFTIVSCDNSNPAIKAGEEFIEKPTVKNYMELFIEDIDNLSEDERKEFEEWCEENQGKLWEAAGTLAFKEMGEMGEAAGSMRKLNRSMKGSMDDAAESMEKEAESMGKAFESMGKAFESMGKAAESMEKAFEE